MKKEMIAALFEQFEQACYVYKGIECWSARELQRIFNYSEWRNFLKVIDKAKDACKNSGSDISNHFVDTNKMVDLGSGSQREGTGFHQLYYEVGAVWIFQLIFSSIWLRYFRFGPFEWLWRSLTYWKRQPMRKEGFL